MTDNNSEPKRASKLVIALMFSPILLIGGCMGILMFPWQTSTPSGTPSRSAATSKYTQTWHKAYKDTTCSEWLREMTAANRWAASADILASARNKISGGSGLPSDALVTSFERNIATACEGEGQVKIVEVAYLIYNYDGTFKP